MVRSFLSLSAFLATHTLLPALGITEEVEALGLKGSKKKKGKKLDEDFTVRRFEVRLFPFCSLTYARASRSPHCIQFSSRRSRRSRLRSVKLSRRGASSRSCCSVSPCVPSYFHHASAR